MTIKSFDLLQPRSLPEAVELLAKHGDEARVIGGGTTLVILMKQRALYYPYLVDLQTIPGLNEIKNEADGVRIGALVTHRAAVISLMPIIVSIRRRRCWCSALRLLRLVQMARGQSRLEISYKACTRRRLGREKFSSTSKFLFRRPIAVQSISVIVAFRPPIGLVWVLRRL